MNVLTLSDYFLPGSKAGGPIRTLENMIQRLLDISFHVVTRDRDLGDAAPYARHREPKWYDIGSSSVRYLTPKSQGFSGMRQILNETPHDVLYLNSFFSPKFTMIPLVLRRFGLIPIRPVVLAPRGEFSTGALRIKTRKKHSYIALSRRIGLYDDVLWQASSPQEAEQIRNQYGHAVQIEIAPDVAPICETFPIPSRIDAKQPGRLRAVFVSRISRMKNLTGAIAFLDGVAGDIQLDVYGPMEDRAYWQECQTAIARLPESVQVRYRGRLDHHAVVGVMSQYDLFLFPTLGENFGHVILEALLAGLPVLVSDTTPWLNLAREGIGWDIPLNQPELFRRVLQQWVDVGSDEYQEISRKARSFAERCCNNETVVDQNRALFEKALGATPTSLRRAA